MLFGLQLVVLRHSTAEACFSPSYLGLHRILPLCRFLGLPLLKPGRTVITTQLGNKD